MKPSDRDLPATPWVGLHLGLLASLAVAQPLYDVLGRNAELFVAQGTPPGWIWAVVVLLSVVPTIALTAVVGVLRKIHPGFARGATVFLVALFAALAALPAVRRISELPAVAVPLAVTIGVGTAFGYLRSRGLRSFLSAFSPAIVAFALVFAFATPVSKVLFPTGAAALGEPLGWGPVPVVFVIFDCLPLTSLLDEHGEVDAVRFPSFARLAATSTWWRQTRTVAPHTTEAVPAILSGRKAPKGTLPIAADHPVNLFTILGGAATRVTAFETATQLCPHRLCAKETAARLEDRESRSFSDLGADLRLVYLHVLLPPALRASLPAVDGQWFGFAGARPMRVRPIDDRQRADRARILRDDRLGLRMEDREAKAAAFIDRLPGRAERSLSYLHLNAPHTPFVFLPSGRRYVDVADAESRVFWEIAGEAMAPGDPRWSADRDLVLLAYRRSLLQTAYVDGVLGRLLDRLEERGILDESLVVVVSDHGRTFWPGVARRDMKDGETALVPFFLKAPRQRRAVVDDRPADVRDVLPTLAAVIGVELPAGVEGRSLLDPPRLRRASAGEGPADGDRLPPESWSPELRTSLARRLEWMPPGGLDRVYSTGPAPELLGLKVEDLEAAGVRVSEAQSGLVAGLIQPERLEAVDPSSGVVPAYVLGKVAGAGEERLTLALALDGRIEATFPTYREGDETRFAALLREEALPPGRHRWRILRVERDPAGGLVVTSIGQGRRPSP